MPDEQLPLFPDEHGSRRPFVVNHASHLRFLEATGVVEAPAAISKADYTPRADDAEMPGALERLRDHLIQISGDPSGSDPAPYLSPKHLEIVRRFALMQKIKGADGWKNAEPILHDDITRRWLGGSRIGNTPVLDRRRRPIVGVRIGYLNLGQFETPVLYCSDGLLRMVIKTTGGPHPHEPLANPSNKQGHANHHGPHHEITYSGHCRLPDPELARPLRSRGEIYLVTYKHQQSKTLEEELGLYAA